jgi:hypothetical protein
MDNHVYLLTEHSRKEQRVICFEKTLEKGRKTLHKIVESKRLDMESGGSEVYSTVDKDKNSISLFKTQDGYISQDLVKVATFRIQKVSQKPLLEEVEVLP